VSPALTSLANDRDCFGAPASVYLWLLANLLDFETYAAAKPSGLAVSMGLSPGTIRRALELLEQKGYLDGRAREDGAREYRMRWSLPPTEPLTGKR
jgi:DNA-binding PadR family transcriptional regulator